MQPLDKTLRSRLERTITNAREVAEDAARATLEQLGAGEAAPFAHLSNQDRELRRRLRVHGRQLGDSLNSGKIQTMDRLIEEVAYEHWHRMLFARFLAENNLLMYLEEEPQIDTDGHRLNSDPFPVLWPSTVANNAVAVTLEECADLAADEGLKNEWEMAARLASRMLPQIFRLDSPVFQLTLPPEHQQKLERLVADLPREVFTASDSLGWVYQFWQADNKEKINKSEVKIGARELPAVTQLFTEPYMVSFLLDNSLGAWWAARRLTEKDYEEVSTKYTNDTKRIEEELRKRASIPGLSLEYLRFVKNEDIHKKHETHENEETNLSCFSCGSWTKNSWTPAAGTFDGWPEKLADLKTLDPCCGSGHFLVAAFLMLVPMRMELEGLTANAAVDAVLRENIHGLELDQRCVELAAFALALTAWKYPGAGGYRVLPELNVACCGLSVSVAKEEWKQLGLGKRELTLALDWMHDIFRDAPVLGSLLDPAKTDAAKLVQWDELSGALSAVLKREPRMDTDRYRWEEEEQEIAVVAQGLARAASLLAKRYHLIITNVPYLARGKQSEPLRDFCERYYPEAKNDLATVFLDRCLELCVEAGTASIVLPQNWLFLTTYKKLREKLLKTDTWHLIARLGSGSFDTISGEVVKAILITLSRGHSTNDSGQMSETTKGAKNAQNNFEFLEPSLKNSIRGLDVSEPRTATEKASHLQTAEIKSVEQAKQLENPDYIVKLEEASGEKLFGNVATCFQGTSTGDNYRFVGYFWETETVSGSWQMMEGVSQKTQHIGGKQSIVRWDEIQSSDGSAVRGVEAFGNIGIAIGQMRKLPATIYLGKQFPNTTPVIIPKAPSYLPAIWTFCMSESLSSELRKINQKLSVDNGYVGKVPFDLEYWTRVAEEKYPNGLPEPYTNDPTQWIFHGHPCGSVIWDEEKKWTAHGPLRTDDTVLQVAVARLLGYRWPAELDTSMELADEQREWARRCEALAGYADHDGIVCIPPVRGEASASDRLLNLLAAAYGESTKNTKSTNENIEENFVNFVPFVDKNLSFSSWIDLLLKNADHAGKTLESWLREKFFTQHCRLFQHRPFIWHIWDGLHDGFGVLVNYHKLDTKSLETLIYTYLGDWISRQKQDIASGVDGAQERLAAAEALKKKLELILQGEAPYDIFVRWKPIEKQPIGWDPDLNDGVRLNIRPFLTVPDVGRKGAGCLRDKPNINWNKDRGKDAESAPWYHVFQGDRINDYHLTLAEKRAAREKEKQS